MLVSVFYGMDLLGSSRTCSGCVHPRGHLRRYQARLGLGAEQELSPHCAQGGLLSR